MGALSQEHLYQWPVCELALLENEDHIAEEDSLLIFRCRHEMCISCSFFSHSCGKYSAETLYNNIELLYAIVFGALTVKGLDL